MQRNHVKFNINRHCLCNKLEGLQKGLEMITETWSFKFIVLPTHTERSRHRQDRHRVTAVQAQAGQAMTRQAGTDKAGRHRQGRHRAETGSADDTSQSVPMCVCVCVCVGFWSFRKGQSFCQILLFCVCACGKSYSEASDFSSHFQILAVCVCVCVGRTIDLKLQVSVIISRPFCSPSR